MTTVNQSFKIRCYPNAEQRRLFAQSEGATRYVRNRVLREMDAYHQATGGYKSVIEMSREVTQWKTQPETAWLAELPSDPLNQELRDLDAAFKNFFAQRTGYPKKKRKQFGCTIRFVFDHRHTGKVKAWAERTVILPKLGKLKLAQPERLPSTLPKLMTLSRDGAGRYFVAFSVAVDIQPLPATGLESGVDFGIQALAVESDGTVHEGAKALRRKLRHLKRQQRALSRKQGARKGEKPSKRYRKQARRVGRIHAKVADTRRDAQHKASMAIIRKSDVIALEDLNVSGMLKNHPLARHLADSGFAELRRQIEYKAAWYGRTVLLADRWAPTSQACSACGQNHDMPLSQRLMHCECGLMLDRDHNAALNILKFAVAGGTGEGAKPNARGGVNPRRPSVAADWPTDPGEARTEGRSRSSRMDRRRA